MHLWVFPPCLKQNSFGKQDIKVQCLGPNWVKFLLTLASQTALTEAPQLQVWLPLTPESVQGESLAHVLPLNCHLPQCPQWNYRKRIRLSSKAAAMHSEVLSCRSLSSVPDSITHVCDLFSETRVLCLDIVFPHFKKLW